MSGGRWYRTKTQAYLQQAEQAGVNLTMRAVDLDGYMGIRFDIDIEGFTGTSVTFTVEYKDPSTGDWETLIASAAKTGNEHFYLQVHPAVTAANNVSLASICPTIVRVVSSGSWSAGVLAISYTLSD